jgi:hypothetical protein
MHVLGNNSDRLLGRENYMSILTIYANIHQNRHFFCHRPNGSWWTLVESDLS